MTAEPQPACPACGRPVHPVATRCRHCKLALPDTARPAPAAQANDTPAARARSRQPWRARWPLVAAFAAVFALGVAVGVLVERWMAARDVPARATPSRRDISPRPVPDTMTPPSPAPGGDPS